MWQLFIIPILCLAASSNALSSCTTVDGNSTVVQHQKCLASQPPTGPFDDKLLEFVSVKLREILRNGSPSPPRLPPLDPFVKDNLSLSLGQEGGAYEPLKLNLKDLTIRDLSNYVVNTATYAIVGSALVVALDIPDIKLTAQYDMDGWMGDGLLYLYGAGDLTVSLLKASLYVELDIGTVSNIAVLECIALDYNVGGVEVDITGLMGGGELGDIFNAVLQDAIPTLIDLAEDTLLGRVSCLLKDKANDLFQKRNTTLSDLLCAAGLGFGCKN